jgi:hypothetical protein
VKTWILDHTSLQPKSKQRTIHIFYNEYISPVNIKNINEISKQAKAIIDKLQPLSSDHNLQVLRLAFAFNGDLGPRALSLISFGACVQRGRRRRREWCVCIDCEYFSRRGINYLPAEHNLPRLMWEAKHAGG